MEWNLHKFQEYVGIHLDALKYQILWLWEQQKSMYSDLSVHPMTSSWFFNSFKMDLLFVDVASGVLPLAKIQIISNCEKCIIIKNLKLDPHCRVGYCRSNRCDPALIRQFLRYQRRQKMADVKNRFLKKALQKKIVSNI